MDVVLDTCAVIWAVSDPAALSAAARDTLTRPDTAVHVSPISCAEIACLAERGRIVLDRHWKPWFNHFTALNGWRAVDIDLATIQEAYSLPGTFHADPADRILVATARRLNASLVTADRKLIDYPHVQTVW